MKTQKRRELKGHKTPVPRKGRKLRQRMRRSRMTREDRKVFMNFY